MNEELETPTRPGYLANSRHWATSLILVVPLFVLYQVGILTTDGWKNGVDFLTPKLFSLSGNNQFVYLAINVAILVVMLILSRFMSDQGRPRRSTWLFILVESALYATILGQVINRILRQIGLYPPDLNLSALDNVIMSLGAGAYEELVFRLLLFSGLLWLGKRLGLNKAGALLVAFLVSSLVFSAVHYQPIGSEPWGLWSFAFRFLAGVIFAILFVTRGFAVAAYTHAIYDIHVLVL